MAFLLIRGIAVLGLVFRVTDAKGTSEYPAQYAIKLELASKKKQRPPSEHEANVLGILADAYVSPQIPRVIDYGYDKPRHSKALVLDLLGCDLQSMRKQCGVLATRLIPTIRYIHSKNFVHRDIKPGNMLLGPKGCETSVYIVEFGISRQYRNPRNSVHMPFLDGKPLVGTVRYASLNTHVGIAQTRRDDIECLAYALIDGLRDLPWGHITAGTPRQFQDRVREKKRSWTPERLCAFIDDLKHHGYSPDTSLDWSEPSDTKDLAPLLTEQARSSPAVTERTRKLLGLIRPADFIKLKLLGPPTVQFSGRFNSINTDNGFWQPPSLAGNEWEFPYRPAIVASVVRNVIVHKGRKGITLSVYPLMMRKEGLDEFPEYIRSRYIPLDASMLAIDSRTPQVEPEWTLANTYIYNPCVTLTVSVDPYLVNPPLEAGQSIRPEDRDETIDIKKSNLRILQTVLVETGPLTPADTQRQDIVWSGRNGWLKEYNQIGSRRDQEQEGSHDADSSDEYDSDYIYDSTSLPGERRKSCTVNLGETDFE
ncbi:kinase-like domain-containing protein [Gautieria morchelliformis]|nr:kinase-like domain-containing protein [Gautieria morchelliformis]